MNKIQFMLNNKLITSSLPLPAVNIFSFIGDKISSAVFDTIRILLLFICEFIYKMIAYFYQIFIILSKIRLLDNDATSGIYKMYNRVTILLGIIMIFVATFYLLKMLLNPDKINDKEIGIGNLLKRIVVVILLIGFTPTIFSIALDFQDTVVSSNLISKVVIGKNVENDDDIKKYGSQMAINLFQQFYKPTDESDIDTDCPDYSYLEEEFLENNDLSIASECLNVKNATEDAYVIDFDGIGMLLVGVIMLYIILIYSLNVGTRVIQLVFLQIVAPIPIVSYIIPKKDGMFGKWVKQVITTYVDLFIRLGIIYFVIELSGILWDAWESDAASLLGDRFKGTLTLGSAMWVRIILVIGVLSFAKRLPQLLQDLVGKPSAASLGFGFKNDGLNMARGAITGAAIGAIGSSGLGRITSAFTGAARGLNAGFQNGNFSQNLEKAMHKQKEANYRDEWLKMQGYGLGSRMSQRLAMATGGLTQSERVAYTSQSLKNLKSLVDDEDEMKDISAWESQAQSYGAATVRESLARNGNLKTYAQDANGNTIDITNTTRSLADSNGNKYEIDGDYAYALDANGNRVNGDFGVYLPDNRDEIKMRNYDANGNEFSTIKEGSNYQVLYNRNGEEIQRTKLGEELSIKDLKAAKKTQGTMILEKVNANPSENQGIAVAASKVSSDVRTNYGKLKDKNNEYKAKSSKNPLIRGREYVGRQ